MKHFDLTHIAPILDVDTDELLNRTHNTAARTARIVYFLSFFLLVLHSSQQATNEAHRTDKLLNVALLSVGYLARGHRKRMFFN